MNVLLVISVLFQGVALAWSCVLPRVARDPRWWLLTLVMALIFARRVMALYAEGSVTQWWPPYIDVLLPEVLSPLISIAATVLVWQLHQHLNLRAVDERQLRLLASGLEGSADPVMITDVQLEKPGPRIVFVNDAACRLTGYTRDELLGGTPRMLQGPRTDSAVLERLKSDLRAGRSFVGEAINYRKDGSSYWVQWSVSPIHGADGRVTHYLGIQRDITEAKRVSEVAERAEGLYRRVADGVNAMLWEAEYPSLQAVFVSESSERLLGYPPDIVRGEGFWQRVIHPDDREHAFAQALSKIESSDEFDVVYRAIAADGRPLTLRDLVTVVRRDGRPVALRGVTVDVTERRAMENRLRSSEARYRALIEATATGYTVLEASGCVVEANAEFLRQTGRRQFSEIIGHSVIEWTAPQDVERNAEEARRCAERGYTRGFEVSYVWPDGTIVPIEINAMVVGQGPDLRIIGLCRDISERKRVESELRESRDRFNQIAESVEHAFWLNQPEPLQVLYVSPGFERIWGVPAAAIYRNPTAWLEAIHPDDRAQVSQLFEMWRRDPKNVRFETEYRVVRPDGTVRWIADRGGTFIQEPGQPLRLAGVAVDITERKRAELATQASEARYRALYENNPLMIFTVARDGTVLDVNPPGAAQLGFGREDLVGQSVLRVFDDEFHDVVRRQLDECFANPDRTHAWQMEKRTRDGRRISVNETARVVEQPDGPVLLIACEDVTERREAFMRLHDSEQRLASMFQHTPLAVILWNTEFHVAEWNPAAELIFGYTAGEAVGRHASFIVPEHARAYVDDVWRGLIANKGGSRGTNDNLTRDGRVIACEWYNSPLVDDKGRVTGVVSLVEDITERKKAEKRQQMLMLELDHRVKNNLASIVSLAEQSLHHAGSLGEFGDSFIGRLRAMSRMHELLAHTGWRAVDIRELVGRSLEAFTMGAHAPISASGEGVLLPSRVAGALNLALHELATNAAKHGALSSPDGRVDVTWRAQAQGDSRTRITLEWVESGGPPVAPPQRRGFGTGLIEGVISYELGGTSRFDFQPGGLRATIELSFACVDPAATTASV